MTSTRADGRNVTINPDLVRRDLDRLRRLQRAVLKGRPVLLPEGSLTALDLIERRLLEAVRRDNTGTIEVDGYPTGNVSAGGEHAAQSSTEGAAVARLELARGERDQPVDRHHGLTEAAIAHLDAAVTAVHHLMEKLDAIDRLATIHRTDPSGRCLCCDRWVEGTANDRLRAGYCEKDYRAWLRAGKPDRVMFERQCRSAA